MAKENNGTYFIKIDDPKRARKLILENTRNVLKILQGYENYRKIRDRRTHLINSFSSQMSGIRQHVLELRKMLPKVSVKDVKSITSNEPEALQPKKEIKKLEQELADIEAKLSSI